VQDRGHSVGLGINGGAEGGVVGDDKGAVDYSVSSEY
jgi:hypothetical protein